MTNDTESTNDEMYMAKITMDEVGADIEAHGHVSVTDENRTQDPFTHKGALANALDEALDFSNPNYDPTNETQGEVEGVTQDPQKTSQTEVVPDDPTLDKAPDVPETMLDKGKEAKDVKDALAEELESVTAMDAITDVPGEADDEAHHKWEAEEIKKNVPQIPESMGGDKPDSNGLIYLDYTFTVDPSKYRSPNYQPIANAGEIGNSAPNAVKAPNGQSANDKVDEDILVEETIVETGGEPSKDAEKAAAKVANENEEEVASIGKPIEEKKAEDEAPEKVVLDYATFIDGSSFQCCDDVDGIDYSRIAMDAGPKKPVTRQTCKTTFAQCRAKNPLFCRFHGPKLLEKDIKTAISSAVGKGCVVSVTKDKGQKNPLTFRLTIGCPPAMKQNVENIVHMFMTQNPGISSPEEYKDLGNGKQTTEFDMDILKADNPPKKSEQLAEHMVWEVEKAKAKGKTMPVVGETPPKVEKLANEGGVQKTEEQQPPVEEEVEEKVEEKVDEPSAEEEVYATINKLDGEFDTLYNQALKALPDKANDIDDIAQNFDAAKGNYNIEQMEWQLADLKALLDGEDQEYENEYKSSLPPPKAKVEKVANQGGKQQDGEADAIIAKVKDVLKGTKLEGKDIIGNIKDSDGTTIVDIAKDGNKELWAIIDKDGKIRFRFREGDNVWEEDSSSKYLVAKFANDQDAMDNYMLDDAVDIAKNEGLLEIPEFKKKYDEIFDDSKYPTKGEKADALQELVYDDYWQDQCKSNKGGETEGDAKKEAALATVKEALKGTKYEDSKCPIVVAGDGYEFNIASTDDDIILYAYVDADNNITFGVNVDGDYDSAKSLGEAIQHFEKLGGSANGGKDSSATSANAPEGFHFVDDAAMKMTGEIDDLAHQNPELISSDDQVSALYYGAQQAINGLDLYKQGLEEIDAKLKEFEGREANGLSASGVLAKLTLKNSKKAQQEAYDDAKAHAELSVKDFKEAVEKANANVVDSIKGTNAEMVENIVNTTARAIFPQGKPDGVDSVADMIDAIYEELGNSAMKQFGETVEGADKYSGLKDKYQLNQKYKAVSSASLEFDGAVSSFKDLIDGVKSKDGAESLKDAVNGISEYSQKLKDAFTAYKMAVENVKKEVLDLAELKEKEQKLSESSGNDQPSQDEILDAAKKHSINMHTSDDDGFTNYYAKQIGNIISGEGFPKSVDKQLPNIGSRRDLAKQYLYLLKDLDGVSPSVIAALQKVVDMPKWGEKTKKKTQSQDSSENTVAKPKATKTNTKAQVSQTSDPKAAIKAKIAAMSVKEKMEKSIPILEKKIKAEPNNEKWQKMLKQAKAYLAAHSSKDDDSLE